MKKGLLLSIVSLTLCGAFGHSQASYTADNDQGGKIIDNVTILSIAYFADTSFGGFHRPGQFQIQISSSDPVMTPELSWLLTSPEDLSAGAVDIGILYATLLSAFNNNNKVLLNVKPSSNNSLSRWYVRAVGLRR